MNLLDIFEQREPYQKAIDALEQRRIEQIREKIDVFKKSLAKATDNEMRAAIKDRLKDLEQELVGHYTPRTEAQEPQKQPAKGLMKGKDLVTPQQRVAGATPAKSGMVGAVKDVAGGLKRWLKGEPDQGPTYEATIKEQELGKRGIGIRNMRALEATVKQGLAKTVFQYPNMRPVFADEQDSDKLADYYNALDSAGRSNFVYNVISDFVKFNQLCKTLGVELIPMASVQPDLPGIPGQGELPLSERSSQKKKFKSTLAQREIEKAMAAEPAAGDPIEAFVLKSIKTDSEQDQQIQDLEAQVANMTTRPAAPPTPVTKPVATTTAAPTPAPTPTTTAGVAPVVAPAPAELPVPEPVAEPQVKDVPKKDKKILSRVKSIEKRLRDRVDAYQTDRVLRDKTPGQLAAMQQQIDSLTSQLAQQKDQLSPAMRRAISRDDVWDVEANLVPDVEFATIDKRQTATMESIMRESRMKRALDDYKMASEEEFNKRYGISKRDFYNTVVNPKKKPFRAPETCPQCDRSRESCVCESVKETFDMPGQTIPRKSLIQGYTVYFNPSTKTVSVTRGGDSEEAAIEQARISTVNMKTFRNAADKLIDRIESTLSEHITKEPRTARERDDMIDKIRRMAAQERNPANLQIMNKDIEILQTKYRDLKEDSDSGEAVEMAIMRRILVAHTDLIVEHGLDKVVQAIEDVAYDVGDVDEIGSSDVSGWVRQVETILGAPKALDEKWTAKYKRSINCANPKGFSQRAHCQGRKKK